MINFGPVPIGAVLPIFFDTFAGSTGASITMTGLAVTDIEVYKGTSMTQRASDAGYTLMDTDGIDIDGITGIHGFSIDTGDNTDAGFYASGSFYTVVVSAVTVDSQTVNFIAATFRCVTAEGVAGQPKVDVAAAAGTAWGSGAITAAAIAASAFNGKGDWNVGKTGYSLTAGTGLGNQTADITGNLSGSVGSVTGAVGSVTAAVALTSAYDFAKGTTAMTEAYAANGAAPTPVQAIMGIHQMLMQFGISGTSYTVKKLDNTTTAFVVTLDSATAPTAAART